MKTQRTAALVTVGFLGAVGLVACSGAAPSDLYSTDALNGAKNPAPTGAVVDDASDGTPVVETPDATAQVDSGPPVVVPERDAGPDVVVKDATPPAPPPTTCGFKTNGQPKTCAQADECCFDGTLTPKLACVSAGACGGFVIACASALECAPGKQCCGTFDKANGYESVTCMDACPAPTTTFSYPQLCTGNPSECPTGTTCQVSGTITGYSICK